MRSSPGLFSCALKVLALEVLELLWTAKIVLLVLGFFNVLVFTAEPSPLALRIVLPLLTLALVVVLRRYTVPRRAETPDPEGLDSSWDLSPALWEIADRTLGRIDAIEIDYDTSLAVRREGKRLRRREILVVGFALVAALRPAELTAVMATMGYFGRPVRRRVNTLGFRLDETYRHRLRISEANPDHRFLSLPFYRWFSPCHTRAWAALGSAHYKRATRHAERLSSPDAVTAAADKRQIVGAFVIREFWPSVWKRTADEQVPPQDVFAEMTERLAGLGDDPEIAAFLSNAAELFRPPNRAVPGLELDVMAARLSDHWAAAVRDDWRIHSHRIEFQQEELEQLDLEAWAGELDQERGLRRARLIEHFRAPEEAREAYEQLARNDREDATLQFELGRLRLALGDPRGIASLERAMDLDRNQTIFASSAIAAYLRAVGRDDEAADYESRVVKAHRRQIEEREKADVRLVPHDLDETAVAAIRDRAGQLRKIDAVYLARRRLPGLETVYGYVFMIMRKRPQWGIESGKADEKLIARFRETVPLPEPSGVYSTTVTGSGWQEVAEVPHSLVYSTKAWRPAPGLMRGIVMALCCAGFFVAAGAPGMVLAFAGTLTYLLVKYRRQRRRLGG